MTKRHVITTKAELNGLKTFLDNLDLSKPWDISIKPYRANRSLEQQALYHIWVKQIAEHLGYDPEELHEQFKERWLVKILERDDDAFAEQLDTYRKIFLEGNKEKAMRLAELARKRCSTTWLDRNQMSELMELVEQFGGEQGVSLTQPTEKKSS